MQVDPCCDLTLHEVLRLYNLLAKNVLYKETKVFLFCFLSFFFFFFFFVFFLCFVFLFFCF